MSIKAFEERDELIKLRSKLELAEQSRLSGSLTFTLSESKERLNKILNNEEI